MNGKITHRFITQAQEEAHYACTVDLLMGSQQSMLSLKHHDISQEAKDVVFIKRCLLVDALEAKDYLLVYALVGLSYSFDGRHPFAEYDKLKGRADKGDYDNVEVMMAPTYQREPSIDNFRGREGSVRAELIKENVNKLGDTLSQLVDDVTSGKKLIPVVKPSVLDQPIPGDYIAPQRGNYSRDPDAPMRPQDVLPVGQFIMSSLKLRRTAKEHMMEAEAERLRQEQRFIPWLGGIEVGTSMVLALKHGTVDESTVAWIHLLQGLRAGSVIAIEHPVNGLIQENIHVQSVNFYNIDKGWRDVAMMIEVSDLNVIEQGRYSTKFYVALNDDLLDEHMVPVINHEWIKITPNQE